MSEESVCVGGGWRGCVRACLRACVLVCVCASDWCADPSLPLSCALRGPGRWDRMDESLHTRAFQDGKIWKLDLK